MVARLRAGDEAAFVAPVTDHHRALVRIATAFAPSPAVAEEVVQDAWLAVIRGIDRFEARSSLRAWLTGIVVNRAKTTGARERRSVPMAAEVLMTCSPRTAADSWVQPPAAWTEEVEDRLVARQLWLRVRGFLDELPDTQRRVVILRDVEGLQSSDVCAILDISPANQRVQLHRGRCRLRTRLAGSLG
jgi:RNA polymerase sigma-70 factor (ECF subfamily)